MSGMWDRTLVYLGLREEPDEVESDLPERFVPADDPHAEHAPPRPSASAAATAAAGGVAAGATSAFARPDQRPEHRSDARPGPRSDARAEPVVRAEQRPRAVPPRDASTDAPDGPERVEESNVRPLRVGDVHVMRGGASAARAALVEVTAFDDVEAVGARYRTGQAVLFDVSAVDRATARRVVDFVSGLTYALRGRLTKVGARAFLLVPDGLDLPADERRRLGDLGYRLPTGSDA